MITSFNQSYGKTFGDIPIYSLHRIMRTMRHRPIEINAGLRTILVDHLFQSNERYCEKFRKKWNCLTANCLAEAITDTEATLYLKVKKSIAHIDNNALSARLTAKFEEAIESNIGIIKKWFVDNSDSLIYFMIKPIPWPVIKRLQLGLSQWTVGNGSLLNQEINEAIMEIAANEN